MRIRSFILFFLLVWCTAAQANLQVEEQSYIVTKTNDTLYGKIKKNLWVGGLKLVSSTGTFKIDPNTYTAYYDAKSGAVYRSKVLPGVLPVGIAKKISVPADANWLKCIADGKIKLYEYKYATFGQPGDNVLGTATTMSGIVSSGGVPNVEFINWYVEKDGVPLTPLKFNSFATAGSKTRAARKQLLKDLLADKAKVAQEADSTDSFTFKTVRALIQEYNNS